MDREYEVTWENLETGAIHISILTAGQMDELMFRRQHSHRVNAWRIA
jgi:hypothetical protein